tara:strand:+ start:7687 stop:8406 length:720 start_codon:yes stop_codon:yes gene_type:complete
MRNFLNLTPKESSSLHSAIYKNALNLKNDAYLIRDSNKSYGSSTSLLILSSEEVIKAILVLLHSEGYKVYLLKDAKKFFSDHEFRHEISKLIEIGIGILNSMDKWEEVKYQKLFNTKSNWFNEVANGIINIAKVAEPILDSISHIEQLQLFNDLKNNGLYVDFRNELFEPRTTVGEKEYAKVLKTTNRIFRFYKVLKILHHSRIKNHIQEDVVEGIKNDLGFFIKEALKGYEFKKISKA